MEEHLKSEFGCPSCEDDYIRKHGKVCCRCKERKPLSDYHKCSSNRLGVAATCKECVFKYQRSPAKYSSYASKLTPNEEPKDVDGLLYIACKKCGRHFNPSIKSINSRIRSINSVGDNNFLYCSEECKNSCDVFYVKSKPKYTRKEKQDKRRCYVGIRRELLKSQCDESGYTYCEMCGDIIGTDLHHTSQISEDINNVEDVAGVMLLCPGCHTKLHSKC